MTVSPSGLHTMTTGLHEGMLTLASLCIIIIIAAKVYKRTFGKILYIDVERIIKFIEPTTVIGALGGSIFLVVSAYIGMFYVSGGADALVSQALLMNKVMMSIFAEDFWIIFLIIRAKYGKDIWNKGLLSAVYAAIGIAGFLFTMETGSLGGHLAEKGSILDPIYELINLKVEQFFLLGTLETYALIGATIITGLAFAYTYRKSKTFHH